MTTNGARAGIVHGEEVVLYIVRACVMCLPITGETKAWRVMRVYGSPSGPLEGPCVAVFAHGRTGTGKEMADKYAEYLIRTRTEVV